MMINHFPFVGQPSVDSGESLVSGSFIFNQLPMKLKAQVKSNIPYLPTEYQNNNLDPEFQYEGSSVNSIFNQESCDPNNLLAKLPARSQNSPEGSKITTNTQLPKLSSQTGNRKVS